VNALQAGRVQLEAIENGRDAGQGDPCHRPGCANRLAGDAQGGRQTLLISPGHEKDKEVLDGNDAKKPATNNTGSTKDANTNIARALTSSRASSEPVARTIAAGTARKASVASVLMTAVIAEQIRK
jgi:hypothetical protein